MNNNYMIARDNCDWNLVTHAQGEELNRAPIDETSRGDDIYWALQRMDTVTLNTLLKSGANPNKAYDIAFDRPERYESLLLISIDKDYLIGVRLLLENGATFLTCELQQYGTSLHLAAQKCNNFDIMLIFLEHFDVDLLDEQGRTALVNAINKRNRYTIRALLWKGIDFSVPIDKEGRTIYKHDHYRIYQPEFDLHIFKLKNAGIPVGPEYDRPEIADTFELIFPGLFGFPILLQNLAADEGVPGKVGIKQDCIIEVRKLKEHKLTTAISLHNILVTNEPQYTSNETIMAMLDEIDFEQYPHYAGLIQRKIVKDKRKNSLIMDSINSLNLLLALAVAGSKTKPPALTSDIEAKIISHLGEKDLVNLIKLASLLKTF